MRLTCIGVVVVTRSHRVSDVRGWNPGTATGYALLMSSNKSETRVQCFPLTPCDGACHNRVARNPQNIPAALVTPSPRAPTLISLIKPDPIDLRERPATVIVISIISDGRGVTVWNGKKQKYVTALYLIAIIPALRVIDCEVDFLVHQQMIISYRGICFPQSAKAVIGLGLPWVTATDLCSPLIVSSLRTCDTFMLGK
ncbi:hypothetical protein T265_11805 [Opisthorchis viverrini]|uniref:Uncharacterized protein n=1 Tax=Opisthorchis viverrini TaxID=6198 RepID=A0A074Z1P5_OPIVI|nr:hypothetical protein T265_11805 [Opisthorchis viverrini]KER19412.1 hypothetical protein T265_11805 [Opisthorchis viverrini]